ncbi:MAG: type III secretion system outer membrane ring subunit SctC [Pseudomonadota bacterium]
MSRTLYLLLSCLLMLVPAAVAADVPGAGQRVEIAAREQPVGAFFSSLYSRIGVPVAVAPGVAGTVNGVFADTVSEISEEVAAAYNVAVYYDGAVINVYPSARISSRSFPVGSKTAAIRDAARELDLPDRLNRLRITRGGVLVASGVPRFLDQIAELAEAVGALQPATPAPGRAAAPAEPIPLAFRVFPLRYAWAEDITMRVGDRETIVPGVASILRSMVGPTSGSLLASTGDGVFRERFLPPTVQSLRGFDTVPTGSDRLGFRSPPNLDPAFGGTYLPDGRFVPDAQVVASRNPIEDAVRIQADKRLNAVIVRDTPDRLEIYDELIDALDQEPQMVEIEATIIDIDVDKARELGINWRLSDGDDVSVGFGNGTASDLTLAPGTDVDDITPLSLGLSVSSILGSTSGLQFISRITALAENGAARIITRPQVLTLSNNEAIFDQTETFFVQVAGEDEVDLFNIAAGTSLRVTPHVFAEDETTQIRLLVTIEDGQIVFAQSVDGLPTVRNSAVNTQALILEGQSLLLGGLTQEIDTESTVKVPLLGDIPILGRLFRLDSVTSRRVERLFLISPRLASASSQVTAASYDTPLEDLAIDTAAEGD